MLHGCFVLLMFAEASLERIYGCRHGNNVLVRQRQRFVDSVVAAYQPGFVLDIRRFIFGQSSLRL